VLLESLNPVERAVFLLREIFGYEYAEVAEIVGRSEANCRQIALRARKQIEARRPRFEGSRKRREELASKFLRATETGDLDGLVGLLSDDIVLWADSGGKVQAARRPITGARDVARFLIGLRRKWEGKAWVTPTEVNGQPGFVVATEREPIGAVVIDITDGAEPKVTAVRIVVNPDKLRGIRD
jgi:RNA polymerase sigma-70 factor (ECF subfamily)